jgi:hypothetical protein
MGIAQFDTKVAVVVRDDLATWQRLNVTTLLMTSLRHHSRGAARRGLWKVTEAATPRVLQTSAQEPQSVLEGIRVSRTRRAIWLCR